MVSYDCPNCGGNGVKTEVILRGTEVETRYISCRECGGSGHIRE